MRTISALLVVLAACGGGAVCGGCSDDGGLPDAMAITGAFESSTDPSPDGCFAGLDVVTYRFLDLNSDPHLDVSNMQACTVSDLDDGWRIACAPASLSQVDVLAVVGADVASGSLTMTLNGCADTFRITSIAAM